ncbi:sensor histidine kinase [Polaromonas glacialis]|uniref:sensor histidine kinase n=1 Tax=Polaromonas glacialis TaxID=866564 RepID=UPI0018DC7361|nr:ATP-binding protein [Polaromonas glacialis]
MSENFKAIRKSNISRFALATGVLYGVLGCLWILASDSLVSSISSDPAWVATAQRYKGLFYVLATSLGLIFLMRTGFQRLLRASSHAEDSDLQVRDLFMQHPKPMWVYDRQTLEFIAVNDAAVLFYGYTREALLSMKLADLSPAEDHSHLQALMHGPHQSHRDMGVVRHRRKSGEQVSVHLTAHAVEFLQRKAEMVMAIDVTAEVLSKHALERQESQFRQLHQSLASVLWMASADGRTVLYVSPALERVYGASPQAMMANPDLWLQAVHPQDADIASASHRVLQATGESNCEYRIRMPSGEVKWVLDRKRLIVDAEGLVTLMGGIVEDITAEKAHEALRAQTHVELERLVAARTVELVRVNAELDAFARTIAHDLKSPLLSVVGFTQILQKRYGAVLNEDGARLTGRIERAAKQMASLVNELLALSRVSTALLAIEDVDLIPVAYDILEELQAQEPHRQVRFDSPVSLQVRADPGLVRPLLANLLGNAWKFTGKRDDACIALLLEAQAPEVVFCVQDNGVGFDASQAEGLFKPFQRFHTLSEFSGTGIGLTTCERITARHHGRIWVQSAPGEGTSVFVTLSPSATASCPEDAESLQAV